MADVRSSNDQRSQNTQLSERQGSRGELTRGSRSEPTSPFSFMRDFMNDMDRLFGGFGFGTPTLFRGAENQSMAWSPQVDISERDGQLLIHADLPGMKQDDIRVNVEEGVLTISGERSSEHEQNQGNVHRRERSYGSFMRSIALPEGVDPESIKASFENGVLEVCMAAPRRDARGRTIPIQPKTSGGAPPNVSH